MAVLQHRIVLIALLIVRMSMIMVRVRSIAIHFFDHCLCDVLLFHRWRRTIEWLATDNCGHIIAALEYLRFFGFG